VCRALGTKLEKKTCKFRRWSFTNDPNREHNSWHGVALSWGVLLHAWRFCGEVLKTIYNRDKNSMNEEVLNWGIPLHLALWWGEISKTDLQSWQELYERDGCA
jgi:hypothetical protein